MKTNLNILLIVFWSLPVWGKINVVTSFTILEDFTAQVGKKHVQIYNIIKSEQDPHSYEPSPQDIKHLKEANLFVINGHHFEGWIEKITQASTFNGKVLIASQGIKRLRKLHSYTDPHLWHNPENSIQYLNNIAEALSKLEPHSTSSFKQNADHYAQQIQTLFNLQKKKFSLIPQKNRIIIIPHDSLYYFGEAFGLKIYSLTGASNHHQTSAKSLAKLINLVNKNKIFTLFNEYPANSLLLKTIARETSAKIKGKLFTGALPKRENLNTYLKTLKYNTDIILSALEEK